MSAEAATRPHPLQRGEFDELRVFLEDVLGIPKGARRFSVTFADGQAPTVSVDYCPHDPYADDPALEALP